MHPMERSRSHRRCRPAQLRTPPLSPGSAIDDLRYIRDTMEASGRFTAVPGWGMVAMGGTALVASMVALRQPTYSRWMAVWIGEAVVAFVIALWAMQRKARRAGLPLLSGPGRKFVFSFAPPMLAAVVLTGVLYRSDAGHNVPGIWLLLYGTAVMTAGAFSVRIVPAMGATFLATGIVTLLAPLHWLPWLMIGGFGVLHIIFGFHIARRYGG